MVDKHRDQQFTAEHQRLFFDWNKWRKILLRLCLAGVINIDEYNMLLAKSYE